MQSKHGAIIGQRLRSKLVFEDMNTSSTAEVRLALDERGTTHPPLRRSPELLATRVACDLFPDKGRLGLRRLQSVAVK